jgi:hypothetical protein
VRDSEPQHKPARRARAAKPRRPKLDLAPVRQEAIAAPVDEPSSEIIREDSMLENPKPTPAPEASGDAKPAAPESLPFVEQPY